MKNEDEELTLEELQKQLKELKEENEKLKEQLEQSTVEEKVIEETDPIIEEVEEVEEEVEEVPAVEDDKETALQTRLEALWQREVNMELKSAGLEAFASFISIDVDDSVALTAKVKELKALLEDYEVDETYQPTNHTNTDAYSLAKAKKDPKEMLRARLG